MNNFTLTQENEYQLSEITNYSQRDSRLFENKESSLSPKPMDGIH